MVQLTLPFPGQPYALIQREGEGAPDDIDRPWLLTMLKAHGALLIRGFAPSLEGFDALTAPMLSGTVFNESPDRLLLDPAANIQSVNGGADAFPLHPELSREPWKPDACFFHCLTPPEGEGGETTICDGVALARALPHALYAALERRRLLYLLPAPPWQLEHWFGTAQPSTTMLDNPPASCPYAFPRIRGQVARAFSRPVLHRTLFGQERAFGNFLLFAKDYLGRDGFPLLDDGSPFPDAWLSIIRAQAVHLTVAVRWQAGDILMLDNSRFMHGRNAIQDPGRRLIASCFGYLAQVERDPEGPQLQPWRHGVFRPPAPPPPDA